MALWTATLLLLIFVEQMRSYRILTSKPRTSVSRTSAKSRGDRSKDAIDPLDGLKGPAPTPRPLQSPPRPGPGNSGSRSNRRRDTLRSRETVNAGLSGNDTQVCQLLEMKLVELEEWRAATLPAEVLVEFQGMMQRGVPIIALFILVEHVALLVPILYKLKQDYNMSIMPFLYIGPALFILPYLIFFLWEYDIVPIPYLDEKFYNFVRYVKRKGNEEIQKHNDTLMAMSSSRLEDANLNVLNNIALSRALSKIDCDKLYAEGIAIRRLELQSAKKNTSTDGTGLGMRAINKRDGSLQ